MKVHILVGDAVGTNLAAANIVWKSLKHMIGKPPYNLKYHLVVVKCCSHQANLAVCAGVYGIDGAWSLAPMIGDLIQSYVMTQ